LYKIKEMLRNEFYELKTLKPVGGSENEYEAFIRLNKDSAIFKGHFPGNPVVPGVCMVQILKELTSEITNTKLTMQSVSNIKFMALINPEVNPDIKFSIVIKQENGTVQVKNACYFDETIALKMGIKYSII